MAALNESGSQRQLVGESPCIVEAMGVVEQVAYGRAHGGFFFGKIRRFGKGAQAFEHEVMAVALQA